MDIQEIAARIQVGTPVTDQERAFFIRNNPYAMAAFMIANNPGSVNHTLKYKLGYNHLGFQPKDVSLAEQLGILIERKESQDFHTVVKNFQVRAEGLTENFINELRSQFTS